jgi:hypothetical protein
MQSLFGLLALAFDDRIVQWNLQTERIKQRLVIKVGSGTATNRFWKDGVTQRFKQYVT